MPGFPRHMLTETAEGHKPREDKAVLAFSAGCLVLAILAALSVQLGWGP